MKVKLTMRPFSLDVEHTAGVRRTRGRFETWGLAMPDTLYRKATRRVIGELLAENRRIRHHQPATLTTAIARAIDAWLIRKYPPPPREYD